MVSTGDPFFDSRDPLVKTMERSARKAALKAVLLAVKDKIDMRLNNRLCEMKPDYDDSIVGFNEAWDIVRNVFTEILKD